MFDKEESIMIFTLIENATFKGKDSLKVTSILNKLDDHISKLIKKEKVVDGN
tara:strand:+ start:16028 stop:16183 length:156 start_codon:yes stop_codon:yes gene_type:complete